MKKKFLYLSAFSLLAAIIMTSIPIGALNDDYINVYLHYYEHFDNYGEDNWNGKTKLQENTVYYVNKKINVTNKRTLPLGSMLVIRNGGQITIKNGGALYIRGNFGVEHGGVINIETDSKLVINTGAIFGVNGSAYVGKGAQLKVYDRMYIYRDALVTINGIIQTYKNGKLYYVDDLKLYTNGSFKGSKQRINGMNMTRISIDIPDKEIKMMRFYDRTNAVTYKISHSGVNNTIINSLKKIKLLPLYESSNLDGIRENNFLIKLYDSNDDEFFIFERPYEVSNGLVYMNGYVYGVVDGGMNFNEFYFYALGVRTNFKRT